MKTKITWNIEGGVQMPVIDTLVYSEWLHAVAEAHGKILDRSIIFSVPIPAFSK